MMFTKLFTLLSLTSLAFVHAAPAAPAPASFELEARSDVAQLEGRDLLSAVLALLPSLQVNLCLTLAADAVVDVGTAVDATITAGACVCIDAVVGLNANAGVHIYTSTGLDLTGDVALRIAVGLVGNSVVKALVDAPILAVVDADTCLVGDITLSNSVYAFQPPAKCCTRTCNAGYTKNAQGQCVSSTPTCDSNHILCAGQCYNKNRYTCPSGIPTRSHSKRDSCGRFTSCPVSGGWECVDTLTNIESCGGCAYVEDATEAWGADCTAIANVESVACVVGRCIVSTCQEGFAPSHNGSICEPLALINADINLGLNLDVDANVNLDLRAETEQLTIRMASA